MKKITITFLFFMIISAGVSADEPFFASQKGMVITNAFLDNKGKIQSYIRMTISDVRGSDSDMIIDYTVELLDGNRHPSGNAGIRGYSVAVTGGILEMKQDDMMDLFLASRNMNYQLTAGTLNIPSNMTGGSRIEDSWMNMIVKIPIIGEITTNTMITNISCTGIETVTVPAGTFEAYKVTMTSITNIKGWGSGSPVTSNITTWYVRGIGAIKSVNVDDKGKIGSSTELFELSPKS
ncbi:MAG: PWI domain-containing protein [Treponema sp.]|nr:PWI domain-containing protein [Treponema sp.]